MRTWIRMIAVTALTLAASARAGGAADRSQLEALPLPDLAGFESVVGARLQRLQDRVSDLTDSGSDAELAEAYGTLGQHYLAHQLRDAAAVAFENAGKLATGDPRWPYYLGYVLMRNGEHEQSRHAFERALELAPGDVPTHLHLGELFLEIGEPRQAAEHFARALDLSPGEAAALAGLGKTAAALDRPADAIGLFRQALAAQPGATVLHYQLALAYRALGDVEAARAELELRGETPVAFADPLLHQIGPLQRGDLAQAVLEMAAQPDAVSDRELADFAVGHLADDGEAPAILRAAIHELAGEAARSPTSSAEAAGNRTVRARLHYVLAGLLLAHDDLAGASAELEAALELAPGMVEANLLKGHLFERRGDPEAAIAVYTRVLDAHPDHVDALRSRASARLRTGREREAVADLEQLCALEPRRGAPRIELAIAHARLGDLEAAREQYRRALELHIDAAEAAQVHHHLGMISVQTGSIERAAASFRTALELDPSLVAAGLDLGAALGVLRRYSEAAAAYRAVIVGDPDNVAARLGEASALALAGRFQQALERLEEGWQEVPESVDLLHALARLLASAPDPAVRNGERALDLSRRTFRAGTTIERLETLAMAYAETGRFDDAVRTQQQAISAAVRGGRSAMVPALEANMERYRNGMSCCAGPSRSP